MTSAIVGFSSVRRLNCSQKAEDGIQRVKRAVETGKNNVLTCATVWGRMIGKEVLGQVHKFDDVKRGGEIAERGASLPHSWFEPHLREANKSFDMRAIFQGGSSAPWWSPGATMLPLPCIDLVVLDKLDHESRLHRYESAFFANLTKSVTLLIRRRGVGAPPWMLALGCACGSAVVCWPLTMVRGQGESLFEVCLDTSGKPAVLLHPIVDPTEWGAMPFETKALAKMALDAFKMAGWMTEFVFEAIKLRAARPPDTLWRTSALEGFFELPVSVLKLMVLHYSLGTPATMLEHL